MAVVSVCQCSRRPLSVIQLGLDHSKRISDHYGHQAGDGVLPTVASTPASTVRKGDLLGHVDEEEFCVVLPNTTLQGVVTMAGWLRLRIQDREVSLYNNMALRASISLGVSTNEEWGEYQFEALQSVADRRLCLTKQDGHNQACFRSEA